VHSLLLWQWPLPISPPSELPPLQAKLEPLPKLAPVPRKPKIRPAAQAKSGVEPVVAAPAVIAAAASAVAAAAETGTTDAPAPVAIEEAVSPPLLPKHAQLHFAVQYGGGTFKVGEISHDLDNIDGRYSLRAVTRTTGLVGIFVVSSPKAAAAA
jgi:hypothetical protein